MASPFLLEAHENAEETTPQRQFEPTEPYNINVDFSIHQQFLLFVAITGSSL
jgi:hypothetical protein